MAEDEKRVYLRIDSTTLSPEEISQRLALEPDEVHHIGDAVSVTSMRWDRNIWELNSGLKSLEAYDKQILSLLERLRGRESTIRALAQQNEVTLVFYAWCSKSNHHTLVLPTKILRSLAELDCGIWCDFYMLGESKPDDNPPGASNFWNCEYSEESCAEGYNIRVYLAIESKTLAPDAVSERLALKPDYVRCMGDEIGSTNRRWECNHWQIDSGMKFADGFDLQMQSLLARVDGREAAIRDLALQEEVKVVCCGIRAYCNLELWLPGGLLKSVAELGAALIGDFHSLPENEVVGEEFGS
ncbi:MAG: DUF4279 domain-containing protein [Candidatus Hydrogenedentales bacterium]